MAVELGGSARFLQGPLGGVAINVAYPPQGLPGGLFFWASDTQQLYYLERSSPASAQWSVIATPGGGVPLTRTLTGTAPVTIEGDHAPHALAMDLDIGLEIGAGLTTSGTALVPDFGVLAGTVAQGNDARLSNDRVASGIRTATTVVVLSGAAAPTAGQVPYASSGTLATWHTLTAAEVGALGATAAAGGDLAGTYPNPTVVDLSLAGQVQGDVAYFDGAAWVVLHPGTAGFVLATGGAGANPAWTSGAAAPTGAAGGDLGGTYPNPTVADLSLAGEAAGDIAYRGAVNWTVLHNGTGWLHNDGAGVLAYTIPTFADVGALGATAAAGGDLTGFYPNPTIAALAVTDAKVATANKDGTAGTPSMRTLGTGAAQATAGNDARLSDDRVASGLRTATTVVVLSAATAPTAGQVLYASSGTLATWQTLTAADVGALGATAAAGGDLAGSYPNPTVAKITLGSDAQGDVYYRNAGGTLSRLAPAAGWLHSAGAATDPSYTTPTAADVGALGATAAAGGDLAGTYPNPTVVNLHVGSDAQGDLLYRNATVWTRLGAGTAGSVLTTGGAGANPAWGASFRVFATYTQQVAGVAMSPPALKTGTYAVLITDNSIGYALVGGVGAATLPAASAVPAGWRIELYDGDGSAATNNLTINRAGADTIDGATSKVINTAYGSVTLRSDGTSKWTSVASANLSSAGNFVDRGGTTPMTATWDYGAFGLTFSEMVAPAAPAANKATMYLKDDGAGVTILCIKGSGGVESVLWSET